MEISGPLYRLSDAVVQVAPGNPGVYALWQEGEMIYVGRAASIKARLVEHLRQDLSPCMRGATHFSWELARRPATRELQLLEEFRNRYGRLPRCNEAA